jgi:hypothetical protein
VEDHPSKPRGFNPNKYLSNGYREMRPICSIGLIANYGSERTNPSEWSNLTITWNQCGQRNKLNSIQQGFRLHYAERELHVSLKCGNDFK